MRDPDPRWDPMFQRGYDPRARSSSRSPRPPSAGSDGAARARTPSPFSRDGAGRAAWDSDADERSRAGDAGRPPTSTPSIAPEFDRATRDTVSRGDAVRTADELSWDDLPAPRPDVGGGGDDEDPGGPSSNPRSARVLIVVLGIVSALAVIAGGLAVVALTTQAPLRLSRAADSASAASQLVTELVAGPVLTAGLLGLAVALALVVASRGRTGRGGDEAGGSTSPGSSESGSPASVSADDRDRLPVAPAPDADTLADGRASTPLDPALFRRASGAGGPARRDAGLADGRPDEQ